jgi:hypothetical protein
MVSSAGSRLQNAAVYSKVDHSIGFQDNACDENRPKLPKNHYNNAVEIKHKGITAHCTIVKMFQVLY